MLRIWRGEKLKPLYLCASCCNRMEACSVCSGAESAGYKWGTSPRPSKPWYPSEQWGEPLSAVQQPLNTGIWKNGGELSSKRSKFSLCLDSNSPGSSLEAGHVKTLLAVACHGSWSHLWEVHYRRHTMTFIGATADQKKPQLYRRTSRTFTRGGLPFFVLSRPESGLRPLSVNTHAENNLRHDGWQVSKLWAHCLRHCPRNNSHLLRWWRWHPRQE